VSWLRRHPLWGIIAAGIAVRVAIAAGTHGLPYDIESWGIVRAAFSHHPLHVYSLANAGGNYHWPYPPGFFPLMLAASGVADLTGAGFTHLVRVPAILADAALVWLIYEGLAGRASERIRLVAAALVAGSPVLIAVSSYSAQIDSVAILPAVAALIAWERVGPRHRALVAGLLIGLAGAIKTVPFIFVLALLPDSRSLKEAGVLLAAAVAVPLVALAPFLVADASGVQTIRHYAGSPGQGGLSLVLQPDLAQRWLTRIVPPSGLEDWLFVKHAGVYNALVVAGYAVFAWRRRPNPRVAAALLWLVVLAFGSGFFFQYLVWGIPFFLLAGYVTATAVMQAIVTIPMLIYYVSSWHTSGAVYVYVAVMLAVWAAWVIGGAAVARRTVTP
jgi:Glycosyltransferase family 87